MDLPMLVIGVVIFVLLLIILVSGVPVAFGIGFLVLLLSVFLWGPGSFVVISGAAFGAVTKYTFVAIPLFILMAQILIYSGAGRQTFGVADKWLGWLPGGLGVSTIGASAFLAAVTGVSAVNAVIIGSFALPEFEKYGYDRKLAAGCVCAGGTLGILIPPSIAFVLYGSIAEVSVGQLFVAGFIPGIMLSALYCLYIFIFAILNPEKTPRSHFSFSERVRSIPQAFPLLALALFMLIALYLGIVTPNEVAGIGVLGAFLLVLVNRQLTWPNLKEALLSSLRVSCMAMWIVIAAVAFGYIVMYTGVSEQVTNAVLIHLQNKYLILIVMNLILVIMGCFMDMFTIMLLTIPLFMPIIHALELSPIWFGVIFVINMEVGYVSPPFGFNLFYLKSAFPDMSLNDIMMGTLPFVVVDLVAIGILIVFPDIALYLPSLMIQ